MSFRRRLLVFGYPALELITLALLIRWIGLGWVLLILLAGVVLGGALMKRAGRTAFAMVREASATGSLPDGSAGLHALGFAGGLLIAIPGIWSKALGLAMQLPPVQALLADRFAGRFTILRSETRFMHGDVVEGTIIRVNDDEGPAEAGPSRSIESR